MEDMDEHVHLFLTGKYTRCLQLINKQQQENVLVTPVRKQFALNNDVALCKYLLVSGTSSICEYDLRQNLEKCRSVPQNSSILSVELTTLYNHLYVSVVEVKTTTYSDEDLNSLYQLSVPTILRVYRHLCPSEYCNTRRGLPRDSKQCCDTLMKKCWSILPIRAVSDVSLQEIFPLLTLCSCMMVVAAMKANDFTTGSLYLDWMKMALQSNTIKVSLTYKSGCLLPLGLTSVDYSYTTQPDYLGNLVHTLLAVVCYQTLNWTGCRHNIQLITSPHWAYSKHFLTGLSHFKERHYAAAVSELSKHGIGLELRPVSARSQARLYNLLGDCLDMMNKPQLCIQMYKEALSADFSYVLSLYNISKQYRKLGATDLELECLSLTVKALDPSSGSQSKYHHHSIDIMELVSAGDQTITYPQALYFLANRYLRLKKYSQAMVQYVDLLTYLTDFTHQFRAEDISGLSVPPVLEVYHEAVQAMLSAREYQSCVTLCDKILSSYPTHSLNIMLDTSIESTGTSNSLDLNLSRKRLRSSESEGHMSEVKDIADVQSEVLTLKYKAEALSNLGDTSGSMDCLQSAIELISSHRKKLFLRSPVTANSDIITGSSSEPHTKRRRLSSTGGSVEGAGGDSAPYKSVSAVEADLYCRLGSALSAQQQFSDALHYYRLAAQLVPDDIQTVYHVTQTLWEMQCHRESALYWLKVRGIPTEPLNTRQLQTDLRLKQQALTKIMTLSSAVDMTDSGVGDVEYTQMDVACLEHLIQLQTRR